MQDYQKRFLDYVIAHKILRFGEFTLKSGRLSPYFFNAGLFNTGSALNFIGECYAAAIVESEVDYDVLFGPAYKGIPLAATTAIALYSQYQRETPYSFNRKEVKTHGEGGNIVGAALENKILVIDDVITAGTAIREVMTLIKQTETAEPAGVVVALDRQEKGPAGVSAIQEIEQQYGIEVISIINLNQIVTYLETENNSEINEFLPQLKAYQQRYGV